MFTYFLVLFCGLAIFVGIPLLIISAIISDIKNYYFDDKKHSDRPKSKRKKKKISRAEIIDNIKALFVLVGCIGIAFLVGIFLFLPYIQDAPHLLKGSYIKETGVVQEVYHAGKSVYQITINEETCRKVSFFKPSIEGKEVTMTCLPNSKQIIRLKKH